MFYKFYYVTLSCILHIRSADTTRIHITKKITLQKCNRVLQRMWILGKDYDSLDKS